MSVINQMLRDLDKQRGAGNAALQTTSVTPVVSSKRWLWLLILVLVLIIIVQQLLLPTITSPSTLEQNPSALNGSEQGLVKKSEPAEATPAQSKIEPTLVGHQGKITVDAKSPIDETHSNDMHLAVAGVAPIRTAKSTTESTEKRPEDRADESAKVSSEETSNSTTPEIEVFVATDHTALATNHVADADANKAEAISEPVLTITRDEQEVNSAARAMAVQRVSPEQQLQLYQQQAEQALAEGRYQQAELLLRQIRALDPQLALPQLAELFWQQQQLVEFDAVVADAESLALTDVRLQRLVLYRLQQQKRWPELLTAINAPLETSYAVEVVALKAQALWQTAQYQPALLAYQQWAALAPNEARAWLGQGLAQEQLAQPKAARVAYQQALQRGGLSPASLQFIQQRLLAMPE